MTNTPMNDWILIVEDQDDLWAILQGSLRRILPQVQTERASNAATALRYLQACLTEDRPFPQMVLSNLYLPQREDGFHLLATIKTPSSGFSHLPVVMMSSSTDPFDQQTVAEGGAYFLNKPAQFKEWQDFLNRIKQYWEASAAQSHKKR